MMDTAPTASDTFLVFGEVVALPTFELKTYETPLVGMAIMFAVFFAVLGTLKLFGML